MKLLNSVKNHLSKTGGMNLPHFVWFLSMLGIPRAVQTTRQRRVEFRHLEYKNVTCRKGQGALEFLIVIGAAVFLFAILMVVVYGNVSEVNREKEKKIIENIALSVQDEISLAVKSTDGYYREFNIPEKIGSQDYNINITGSRIYIETSKNAASYPVKDAEGNIKKGLNVIKKENGRVYLNP